MRASISIVIALLIPSISGPLVFATIIDDRAAVEKVYHNHRTGTQKSFEEAIPLSIIRQLVEEDLAKERALKNEYGVTVSDALIMAEVNRINQSTRAPEMLKEIRAALGNDPLRFANTVVKPVIVERILRNKYNNDDKRHAGTRKAIERVRESLLKAMSEGVEKQEALLEESGHRMSKTRWIMTSRPVEIVQQSPTMEQTTSVMGTASGGRYSIESIVQVAAPLPAVAKVNNPHKQDFYFEDLHPELQKVLKLQLQKPGDVSAVIERPTGFQVFLSLKRTAEEMEVAALTIQKHSYDEWLAEHQEKG